MNPSSHEHMRFQMRIKNRDEALLLKLHSVQGAQPYRIGCKKILCKFLKNFNYLGSLLKFKYDEKYTSLNLIAVDRIGEIEFEFKALSSQIEEQKQLLIKIEASDKGHNAHIVGKQAARSSMCAA